MLNYTKAEWTEDEGEESTEWKKNATAAENKN